MHTMLIKWPISVYVSVEITVAKIPYLFCCLLLSPKVYCTPMYILYTIHISPSGELTYSVGRKMKVRTTNFPVIRPNYSINIAYYKLSICLFYFTNLHFQTCNYSTGQMKEIHHICEVAWTNVYIWSSTSEHETTWLCPAEATHARHHTTQ